MADIIIMPKLGFNMDEGKLLKWCVAPGDSVKKGDALFEIETDKTVMSVEATRDGVLLKTVIAEGDLVPVFTPMAVVGDPGEDADAELAKAGAAGAAAPAEKPVESAGTVIPNAAKDTSLEKLQLTPKARKLIGEEDIDPASVAEIQGTGFRGGITAKDIKASPLARKAAARDGIDLAGVSGSGIGGKVMKDDVDAAANKQAARVGSGEKLVLSAAPYKGVRKIIGDRLSLSKRTAPHLYFTDSIDMTEFNAFRKKLNESGDAKVAVSDLMVMAACRALQKYPGVNASLVDDQIVTYESVNVGMAVAGNNGLIVPVVKNVQQKSLSAVAKETRDLVERAKEGRLTPEEYNGGTFTISNLGMFGIENFTAIINPPESAIIAVSSVRKKPVVVTDEHGEDAIAIRPMMNIQLTVDHRLIDGLLAAQFVAYFKALLESPLKILV
ncbi:MAG: 2-oxo acid dehydrogenase subunit E2 [Defluviitaleaceae bacterium]|nr:2-oxo acid dehydrogenase subunit E2 [Defluviitaleaceae bacterium]